MTPKQKIVIAAAVLAGLLPVAGKAQSENRPEFVDNTEGNRVSSPRYIPHITQGHGWETRLHLVNVCFEPQDYRMVFFGADGKPKSFFVSGPGAERWDYSLHSGDAPLAGRGARSFIFPDPGDDLLQGYGTLLWEDCVSVDAEYRQNLSTGEVLSSMVPIQRRSGSSLVLSLRGSTCDIGVAVAGTGGDMHVEAVREDGSTVGGINLSRLHHAAFSLNERIPGADRAASVHIRGAVAAVGLEFCKGKLTRFRLPHPQPASSESNGAHSGAVVVSDDAGSWGDDDYVLNAAEIASNTLTLNVSYGGGCATHQFTLVASESFMESSPVQLAVSLAHDANGDPCEAWLTRDYEFDLRAIRDRYRESYGQGAGIILLLLNAVPEPRTLVYAFREGE